MIGRLDSTTGENSPAAARIPSCGFISKAKPHERTSNGVMFILKGNFIHE